MSKTVAAKGAFLAQPAGVDCIITAAVYGARIGAAETPDSTLAADVVATGKPAEATPVAIPEPSAQTLRYYRSGNVLWLIATLGGLVAPAAILFSGCLARLRDWEQAIGRTWFFTVAVYVILYLAFVYLIDLPLNWYQGDVRAHTYGLSNETFGQRFGFTEPSDIASLPLPLPLLLFSAFFLLAQRIALAYSRHIERDADRFALEITRDNRAMATAFAILQNQNLVHPRPGPVDVLWRARHPSIAERVELANRYRPWDRGEPLVYGDRF